MKNGLKVVRERIDITSTIGPLFPSDKPAEWQMCSYDRPAYMVWNAIANALYQKGWTRTEIRDWLQSKNARWALDGELGTLLIKTAEKYAEGIER